MTPKDILQQLKSKNFDKKIMVAALSVETEKDFMPIFGYSTELCGTNFGKDVFIRGIVEFTNHCRRNCNYCGIRKGNLRVKRYRIIRRAAAKLM
jgi:biotin synthase